MERHIKISAYIVLALTLLLTGCASKKKIQSGEEAVIGTVSIATLQAVMPDTVSLQNLSANANIKVAVNGNDISIKGKLRIKRGEGKGLSGRKRAHRTHEAGPY